MKSLLEAILSRERPVDLAIVVMVVLATMLLGASYHAPVAVWTALLLVAASVYLNDITGWLRLERRWASWLSLAAVVAWCLKARLFTGDWQLAAISYVLLILQIVLLFQTKSNRIIWQVILLSVGLVAVAAGLSPGLWFGPLLILYTLVGLTALALLGLDRPVGRQRRSDRRDQRLAVRRRLDRQSVPVRRVGRARRCGSSPSPSPGRTPIGGARWPARSWA